MKAFCNIYHLLLKLYPISFRVNFGDEMEGVFATLLKEKARQGRLACWRVFFKEAVSLPVAAAGEHLKMRGVPMAKKIIGLGLWLYSVVLVVVAVGLLSATPAPRSQVIGGVVLGRYDSETGFVYLSGRHLRCEQNDQSKGAACSIEVAGQMLEIHAQRDNGMGVDVPFELQLSGTCQAFYDGQVWPCRSGNMSWWTAEIPEPLGLDRSEIDLLRQKYWIENLPEGVFLKGILVFSIATTLIVMLTLGIWFWHRIRSRVVWGMAIVMVGVVSLCGNLVVGVLLTGSFVD